MLTTTEEQIKAEFEAVKTGSVERVKKLKDFAFVHFKEREDAIMAMKKKDGSTIDGAVVEVTLSKPVDKNNSKFMPPQQILNPLHPQLVGVIDPAELNLLQALHGMASTHSIIPAFPQTLTFTDSASNIQYQIANPHFQLPITNIPNGQLQSPLMSQNQMLLGINNMLQDQGSFVSTVSNGSKPGGRVRTTAGARVAGGIHRPVYYNSVKGVNGGGIKRQLSGEDVLHDFYSGVKPVPMLPLNTNGFTKYSTKAPFQVNLSNETNKIFMCKF